MTDPITDMINRIKNAQAVFHETVEMPFSNLKYEIAQILEKEGLVKKVEKKGKTVKRTLEIALKYQKAEGSGSAQIAAISGFRRISKPGQRLYIQNKDINRVRDGHGFSIISTPKGLLTNREARKQKVGGEIMCEVW